METRQIDTDFSVSAQLQPEGLDVLADNGIKTIICNRPEHETVDQPELASLQRHADKHGLALHYQPVVHDKITLQDVREFEDLYMNSEKPIHAYCRSGLRAMTLWGLMRIAQGEDPGEISAKAQHAGFDFSSFQDKFADIIMALRGNASP